nr:reverse transcriptase domain-containing protein [Tanacetum cinerariifolium]
MILILISEGILAKALQERPQGSLPSDIVPNPTGEIKAITTLSGIVLVGPSVPPPPLSSSFKEPSSSSRSSKIPLSPSSSPSELHKQNPYQPLNPYPSRLNKEKLQDKSDIQVHKFLQMFKKLHFNISLAEALALMLKYAKILKDLLSDKEKLLGLANTSLTENCSAVLLKKLSEKHKDPMKFLSQCDFPGLEKCMALADLGASINIMALTIWKKLMLPELVPTHMTLELANRTARALVDGEELILRDGDEKLLFYADSTLKYPPKHGNESINMINFIDITCDDHFQEVLQIKKSPHPLSDTTTPPSNSFPSLTSSETSDSSLEEFADELALL